MQNDQKTREEMNAEIAADIEKYGTAIEKLVDEGTFPKEIDNSDLAIIIYTVATLYEVLPGDLVMSSRTAALQMAWTAAQAQAIADSMGDTHGSC